MPGAFELLLFAMVFAVAVVAVVVGVIWLSNKRK